MYPDLFIKHGDVLGKSGQMYIRTTSNSITEYRFFCIEFVISSLNDEAKLEIILASVKTSKEAEEKGKAIGTNYYCLIISSVFLILVFLVYIILPELLNLGGKILMAYVVSLLLVFILLARMQIAAFPQSTCINITALIYFGILSSFCWLNVMSIDIWWTFRGYAKARLIHRRGENFKFCMYCLYGWGLPVIMTIGLVVVNAADLSQWPWIVTPGIPGKGCFFQDKQKYLYLYTPMTILIVSNWMFFLMTAYNIRRLMRGTGILSSESTAAGNPAAHRREKNRLIIYLKLSVIMGINWLFEILSAVINSENVLWQIADYYNIFTGIAIFLIFVFKKKIYYKLKLRFRELLSCFHKSHSTQMTTRSKSPNSTNQSTRSQSTHTYSSSKF